MNIFLVFIGGGLGAVCRFLISKTLLTITSSYSSLISVSFLLGTLFCNILGSFLIGCLMYVLLHYYPNDLFKLILITGFLGGFTTFSSFGYESMVLLQNGNYLIAIYYILGSIFLGLMAVFLGFYLMKVILI